ncbi:MAG: helix-turn-helix domain-containing protein [Bilifractor sp.]
MTEFWKRYTQKCIECGLKPVSQEMAEKIGVSRSAISAWNVKKIIPNGTILANIADILGTTTDYLLGRTESEETPVKQVKEPATEKPLPEILALYNQLDRVDQAKVEGIVQGLLMADKYKTAVKKGKLA